MPKPSIRPTPSAAVTPDAHRFLKRAQNSVRDFCGLGSDATCLWPRWLILRSVGLIFILIFSGLLHEGQALCGPGGLVPLEGFFAAQPEALAERFTAFFQAPSLYWLSSSATAITLVTLTGLVAALALAANLWPRAALLTCWVCLLSFVTTWRVYSGTQLDQFMLEAALICLPFAPAGYRPGLGAASPPRPIALFMLRWLVFRVMFEAGLMKLIAGDERWLDFTAMDALYETAPFPTFLGFLDHQMPHAYHVAEWMLTFVAELVGPVLAVIAGRRGRGFALIAWIILQIGIQLTCNFGWLNAGAIGLGLVLLDDQILATAARRCRLNQLAALFTSAAASAASLPRPAALWSRYALRGALGAHFALTLLIFIQTLRGALNNTPVELPTSLQPLTALRSANAYTLYAHFLPYRFAVEFEGSNDGGETWRPYSYRYQPQRPDQISPFIAPWYPRFEATLQVQANTAEPSPFFATVAAHLLARSPAGLSLFATDPFPEKSATMIRIRGYRLSFVDLATHRAFGHYWRKNVEGDYLPLMYQDEHHAIAIASTETDIIRAHALHGNRNAQNKLGALYAYGEGVAQDHAEATRWFHRAADQDHPLAQYFLGLSYAEGKGVEKDFSAAADLYRRSAMQGYAPAQINLGVMYARGETLPVDETEALAWFLLAAQSGQPDAVKFSAALERRLGPVRSTVARRRSETLAAEIANRTTRP